MEFKLWIFILKNKLIVLLNCKCINRIMRSIYECMIRRKGNIFQINKEITTWNIIHIQCSNRREEDTYWIE